MKGLAIILTMALASLGSLMIFAMPAVGSENEAGMIKLYSVKEGGFIEATRLVLPDEEWRKKLTPEQFHITREKGTERAFTGKYDGHKEHGVYKCIACGTDLFHSDTKFDSGTGWPSYYQPVAMENILLKDDRSWFMVRTEVLCARCDAHLGHVFKDGPPPTGLRYCINSASLDFEKLEKKGKGGE